MATFITHFRIMRSVLLIAVCVLLSACASAEITSNKAPDYDGTIQKLYVQSYVSERLDRFPVAMANNMIVPLSKRGVDVASTHEVYEEEDDDGSSGPALAEEDTSSVTVDFEMARERAYTHVMLIEEKSREEQTVQTFAPASNGGPPMMNSNTKQLYTFGATLYVSETEERVWRASIEVRGSEQTSQEMEASKAAEKIIEQLVTDELLPAPSSPDA